MGDNFLHWMPTINRLRSSLIGASGRRLSLRETEAAVPFLLDREPNLALNFCLDDIFEPAPYALVTKELFSSVASLNLRSLDGDGWYFPFPRITLAMPSSCFETPIRVAWLDIDLLRDFSSLRDYDFHLPVGDEKFLLIETLNLNRDVGVGSESAMSLTPSSDIGNILSGKSTYREIGVESSAGLLDALRFVIKLGIYLSISDEDVFHIIKKNKSNSPKHVRTVLEGKPIRDIEGGTLVSSFLRNLKNSRYYQGKWEAYPIGSRYVLVKPFVKSGHARPNFDKD